MGLFKRCFDTRKNYKNKPKTYPFQATIEHINAGLPYYVGSEEFGYEGKHLPVKNTINNRYSRSSLLDNGVIYQTYSDRMAFTTEQAARYYSITGKLLKEEQMTKDDLRTGMIVELADGAMAIVLGGAIQLFDEHHYHGGIDINSLSYDLSIENAVINKVYAEKMYLYIMYYRLLSIF